jgi:hypothetical protein
MLHAQVNVIVECWKVCFESFSLLFLLQLNFCRSDSGWMKLHFSCCDVEQLEAFFGMVSFFFSQNLICEF